VNGLLLLVHGLLLTGPCFVAYWFMVHCLLVHVLLLAGPWFFAYWSMVFCLLDKTWTSKQQTMDQQQQTIHQLATNHGPVSNKPWTSKQQTINFSTSCS
jgi:membrane protein implicated in regulation of membrane protease activity